MPIGSAIASSESGDASTCVGTTAIKALSGATDAERAGGRTHCRDDAKFRDDRRGQRLQHHHRHGLHAYALQRHGQHEAWQARHGLLRSARRTNDSESHWRSEMRSSGGWHVEDRCLIQLQRCELLRHTLRAHCAEKREHALHTPYANMAAHAHGLRTAVAHAGHVFVC